MRDGDLIRRGDAIQAARNNIDDPDLAIAALPAVQPVVKVKPLDRAQNQDAVAGWTLPIELLCAIKDDIRPSGYGGAVCLEEVEMIALSVEARILAALDVQPAPDVAGLVEALRGLIYGADETTRDRARHRGIAALAAWEASNG